MGLHLAWPEAIIVGVDIKWQPNYCGHEFVQADAMTFPLRGFDFIWASPPCERYSQCTPKAYRDNHPDLIDPIRKRMNGTPFVIENVASARRLLRNPMMLCGSMFGLGVKRHRYFESSYPIQQPICGSHYRPVLITGTHRRTYEPRYEYSVEQCRVASGVDWMTRVELDKAIPPAYSRYIAEQYLLTP